MIWARNNTDIQWAFLDVGEMKARTKFFVSRIIIIVVAAIYSIPLSN